MRGWRAIRLLVLLVLVVLALLFALGREASLRALLPLLLRQVAPPAVLQVGAVHGSLWGPLRLERIAYRQNGTQLEIDRLDLDWQPAALLAGSLSLTQLHVGKLNYHAAPSSAPLVLPRALGLPLALQLDRLQIDQMEIESGGQMLSFQQLQMALSSKEGYWQLRGGQVQSPWGKVQLNARLAHQAPFGVQGDATLLDGALPLQLSGNLADLQLAGQTVQHQSTLQGKLDLTLFEAFPMRSLQLNVQHLNPALWQADAPRADLNLVLDARKLGGQWQGHIRLDNAASGLLDQRQLPLRHLSAKLGGSDRLLQLQNLMLDMGSGGQLQGQLDWNASEPLTPQLVLRTGNLNLQGLHSTMRATRIAGQFGLKMETPLPLPAAGRLPSDHAAVKGQATPVQKQAAPAQKQAAQVQKQAAPAQNHAAAAQKKALSGQKQALSDQKQVLPEPKQAWTLRTSLTQQGLQLNVVASLNQRRVQVQQVRLVAGAGQLQLAGEVDLALPRQFAASGQLQHFDPAWFGKFPAADLNADLQLKGRLDANWQVQAQANLRPSRLLQQNLLGSVNARLDHQRIEHLDLALRFGLNTLRAQGALGSSSDKLQWQIEGHDLQSFGWAGQVQAQGVVSGGMQNARTTLLLNMAGLRRAGVSAGLSAGVSAGENARLQAQGEILLTPVPGVNLAIEASHLNPAAWGAYPLADLSAKATIHGQGGEHWQGGLKLESLTGSLLDKPLSGQLAVEMDAQRLRAADMALSWGRNQFSIKQQAMSPATQDMVLDWRIDAPQLMEKMAALQASGRWQGNVRAHTLAARLTYGSLQTDFLLAGGWQSAGHLPAMSTTASSGKAVNQTAGVPVGGALLAGPMNSGAGWQGSLQSLHASGGVALQAPVSLQWNQSRQALSVQRGQVNFDGGNLMLDLLEVQAQQWRTRGSAHGVPLALLASLNPAWQTRLAGGLRFGAQWDLAAGEHLNGKLQISRESGDWQPGIEIPQGLGLQTLMAKLELQQDKVVASMELRGKQIGQAQAGFSTMLEKRDGRWGLPGNSPLQLQASAKLDSIAPLAGLSNGQISFNGSLALQVTGTGSIGNPLLSGTLIGENLGLNWAAEGLKLKNGGLRAQWRGQTLQIEDLHFDGVAATGNLRIEQGQVAAHLGLTASQWMLLSRPDRILEVSGQAGMDLAPSGVRLSGKLKAERAMLELVAQDAPVRSQDIRLLRGKQVMEKPNPTLPLSVQLELDLGEQFHVKGQGLDARLAGKLRWQALERRGPRLVGEVQVVEGSYRAYGQKLLIERGAISFSGAWDNPGLNVLAMRQRLDPETEVDVGIELRGSLLAPQVRLVSTPPLPDSEKLAWLVLGHGLEGAAGQDMDVLGAASSAFFGSTRDNVANRLGLDEIGVSYAKGVENAVFTVGKRLSRRAYLSFEQGLGSATGLVKLRYTLNPRVSVQLQTGSNNAVDVFYSWRFD